MSLTVKQASDLQTNDFQITTVPDSHVVIIESGENTHLTKDVVVNAPNTNVLLLGSFECHQRVKLDVNHLIVMGNLKSYDNMHIQTQGAFVLLGSMNSEKNLSIEAEKDIFLGLSEEGIQKINTTVAPFFIQTHPEDGVSVSIRAPERKEIE